MLCDNDISNNNDNSKWYVFGHLAQCSVLSSSPWLYQVGTITTPILQMKSLGHGDLEFTWLISGRANTLTLLERSSFVLSLATGRPSAWSPLYSLAGGETPWEWQRARVPGCSVAGGWMGGPVLRPQEHPGPCRRLGECSLGGTWGFTPAVSFKSVWNGFRRHWRWFFHYKDCLWWLGKGLVQHRTWFFFFLN